MSSDQPQPIYANDISPGRTPDCPTKAEHDRLVALKRRPYTQDPVGYMPAVIVDPVTP